MFNKHVLISLILLLCIAERLSKAEAAQQEAVDGAKPRRCYSCEGINCMRTSKLNATVNCSDMLDICVTVFEGSTVVARGCYVDMPESHRLKCASNQGECVKCFGQLCNNKGRADFKCIVCNSNENAHCISDTSAMTPQSCDVPTAPNSYCYVRESPQNGVITRGCYVHQQEQLDCYKDSHCSMCLPEQGEVCNSFRLLTASTSGSAKAAGLRGALLLMIIKGGMILKKFF